MKKPQTNIRFLYKNLREKIQIKKKCRDFKLICGLTSLLIIYLLKPKLWKLLQMDNVNEFIEINALFQ